MSVLTGASDSAWDRANVKWVCLFLGFSFSRTRESLAPLHSFTAKSAPVRPFSTGFLNYIFSLCIWRKAGEVRIIHMWDGVWGSDVTSAKWINLLGIPVLALSLFLLCVTMSIARQIYIYKMQGGENLFRFPPPLFFGPKQVTVIFAACHDRHPQSGEFKPGSFRALSRLRLTTAPQPLILTGCNTCESNHLSHILQVNQLVSLFLSQHSSSGARL